MRSWRTAERKVKQKMAVRRANCDCLHVQGNWGKHFCDTIFAGVPGTSDMPPKLWRVGCSRPLGHKGSHRACDHEDCCLWEWENTNGQ
jgi:hypothetical protein